MISKGHSTEHRAQSKSDDFRLLFPYYILQLLY